MDDTVTQILAQSRIPVVVSGVEARASNITRLRIDRDRGMQRVLDHLCSLGHRKMAFVDHHSSLEGISERRKAFLEGMARSDRGQSRIFSSSDSLQGGRQAARDVLASGLKPTAVVCVNDRMAIGVLKELCENGIKAPEHLSVAGFVDTSYSEYVSPPLTTFHIDREKIALHLFEILAAQRPSTAGEIQPVSRDTVIDTQLVVRESTGPAFSDWASAARGDALSRR